MMNKKKVLRAHINMYSTSKQVNNKDSKMPLSQTLPGTGTILLRNVFEGCAWK